MDVVLFLLTGLLLIKQCKGQDGLLQCGNCMDTNHFIYCNNDAVISCVCAKDPDCCSKHWDSLCVLAVTHPEKCNYTCVEEHCGDCLTVQTKNGCSNKRIESCICEIDPACCNNEWDSLCVDEVQRFEWCWRGGCDNRTIADPIAACKNITVFLNASGVASTTIDAVNNGSSNDAGKTLRLDDSTFGCEDVSANKVVHLAVNNAGGKTDTCSANVTVQDTVKPTAICQNVTVSLNGSGIGLINPENINAGSSDACGISNLSLNETSFSCQDVGSKHVRFTVTDNNGNNNSCLSHVKVQGCGLNGIEVNCFNWQEGYYSLNLWDGQHVLAGPVNDGPNITLGTDEKCAYGSPKYTITEGTILADQNIFKLKIIGGTDVGGFRWLPEGYKFSGFPYEIKKFTKITHDGFNYIKSASFSNLDKSVTILTNHFYLSSNREHVIKYLIEFV